MSLAPFFALFVIGLFISGVIAFWFPEYSKYYVKDNRVVENIGAQLFLWSGIVSLWAAWLWRGRKVYVPTLFALLGFVCALDEISWGRGEIEFEPYQVMGVKIDALHDFMDVFRNVLEVYGANFGFWALLASFLIILMATFYRLRHFFVPFFTHPRGILFAIIIIFFFISSLGDLLDLELSKNGKMYFSMFEEYLETAGALALFFIALSLVQEGRVAERNETIPSDIQAR